MNKEYNFNYIDNAKKFVEDNDIEEMYVRKRGKNFSFYIYPHEKGFTAAHPVIPPKYTTPCYPEEHGCRLPNAS